MKSVYPIMISRSEDGWFVANIPDFDRSTQGHDLAEAISMARDLIELTGVSLVDIKMQIPPPSAFGAIQAEAGEFVTLVDVDFEAYRTMLDNRSVRKNCTLPSWLNAKAEKADLNFSQILQEALMEKLGIERTKVTARG